mgnify:CR=1 FL=1
MDIGFVTSLVSIPLVGALGTAAWRIQATITARKQSEIDQLKTEIESVRTIHAEQMTLQKEKTELSNDQMDTLIRNRTQEMTEKIEIEYKSNTKVFVSLDKLSLVHKYIGAGKAPKVSSLGSKRWGAEVARAKKAAEDIALDVLRGYSNKNILRPFEYVKENWLFRS